MEVPQRVVPIGCIKCAPSRPYCVAVGSLSDGLPKSKQVASWIQIVSLLARYLLQETIVLICYYSCSAKRPPMQECI